MLPSKMAASPVVDTISEIMERIPSLPVYSIHFTSITENVKQHLSALKEKCSTQSKLDLTDPATLEWLQQVTDAVTDLFHLVDDLSADVALLQKQSNMVSFFSACNLTPLLRQLKEIEKRLHKVASQHGVKYQDVEEEETHMVRRKHYKRRIKNSILKSHEKKGNVEACVIEGFAGMGKTKLVKAVCEAKSVKKGFDVLTWIDGIREKYDAESVVKRVVDDLKEMEKNEKMEKKKDRKAFLVVVDDFHNENSDEWKKLKEKLKEVAATSSSGGGALLVTTRSGIVGKFLEKKDIYLRPMHRRDSKTLFEKIAGARITAMDSKSTDDLLKMCRAVPGAIVTMGRLVRSFKPSSDSEINQLKQIFEKEMQLTYYNGPHLPSCRLRQCFAHSLFLLSAASLKVDTLIRLWMAEGFLGSVINSSSSQEPEDLGLDFIQEFKSRKIFRISKDGQISSIRHRVHAISSLVVGNDNLYAEVLPLKNVNNRVRRVGMDFKLDVSKGIPSSLFEAKEHVRTFLLPMFYDESQSRPPNQVKLSWSARDEIFSKFKRLRVLILNDLGMGLLPSSIGKLKSLRYLDLSHNRMEKLPHSIGELKHLQTLLLSHCHSLKKLPNKVNHFPSLRHLHVDGCNNLKFMPCSLKKLTWLRSLPHFVASKHKGLGEELLHLNNLRGELEISHLERVKFKDTCSYLKEKRHLECLILRWNHQDENPLPSPKEQEENEHKDQIQVLSQLEPHQDLKRLSIIGYKGNQIEGWLSSLQNLVEISLSYCSKCDSLPSLAKVLVRLKKLTLRSLDSLQFITITEEDSEIEELGLEQVRISNCPNLKGWWKNKGTHNTVFSSISELVVEYCPNLCSMPLFPELEDKLVLDCSNMKPLFDTLSYHSEGSNSEGSNSDPPLSSLIDLTIKGCKDLKSTTKGLNQLFCLENLHISNCTEIDLPSDEWKGLESLESIRLENIPDLCSLPEGMRHLTSLNSLTIKSCPKLKTLIKDEKDNFLDPQFLEIEDCPKLESLPQTWEELIRKKITKCPLLEAKKSDADVPSSDPKAASSEPLSFTTVHLPPSCSSAKIVISLQV